MLKKFVIILLLGVVCQVSYGQRFSIVTPSNHTVYFELNSGEAEAAYCTYSMPNYGTSLSGTLIIPDSVEYNNVKYPVTAIGYNAFHHSYGIDTVILPNTITSIKQEAFCACSALKSVSIPNSVIVLGNNSFSACHSLSDLTIGESVVTIGDQAFDADTSLVSVVIPNSVVSIGQAAFSQNYSLCTIRFGSSLTSIGFACFTYCPHLDSLIFVTEVSPYYGGEFWGTPDTLNLIIPCGSYHSYSFRFGTQHNYTVPTVDLDMDVYSMQPQWGNAAIVKDADSNDVRCDSSVVIKATPNYGYHFQQWSNGSTRIQDTLYIIGDSSVSAFFAKNQYSLTVQSFNDMLGTVTGAGNYDYLDTVVVTAYSTAPHYFFERWSDGNTDSVRSVVITGNMMLTAYFAIDTHTVVAQAENIAYGSVSGEGRYIYGAVATLTAAPYSGYRFSHWSNGATYNPYVFAVVSDTVLMAYFIAEGEPYQDTIYLHDTVYVPVHDTLLQHDTVYLPQYIYDTIYIRDTVFVGIGEMNVINAKIYTSHGQIVVESGDGMPLGEVQVFDMMGRMTHSSHTPSPLRGTPPNLGGEQQRYQFDVPGSGTYLVKIGSYPAQKVVVIR